VKEKGFRHWHLVGILGMLSKINKKVKNEFCKTLAIYSFMVHEVPSTTVILKVYNSAQATGSQMKPN
jgi:hypothetical protein